MNKSKLTLAEAAQDLGLSESTIRRRIDSGDWREGKEWFDYRGRDGLRRIIRIDIQAVKNLLSTPAHQRKTKTKKPV